MSQTTTHNTQQHTTTHNNTQQHTTTHNNTQQHTTTHNNTQQHTTTNHSTTHNNNTQQQQHTTATTAATTTAATTTTTHFFFHFGQLFFGAEICGRISNEMPRKRKIGPEKVGSIGQKNDEDAHPWSCDGVWKEQFKKHNSEGVPHPILLTSLTRETCLLSFAGRRQGALSAGADVTCLRKAQRLPTPNCTDTVRRRRRRAPDSPRLFEIPSL